MSAITERDNVTTGRPRKFQDIAQFQAAIDAYFVTQEAAGKPYTMHGLARALDCSRRTLLNYEQTYADDVNLPFMRAVKSARERVAEFAEEGLWKKGQHPAGPIFVLKNNFGWQDVQSVNVSVGVALGVQTSEEQRRAMVPTVTMQQIPSINADVVQAGDQAHESILQRP